MNGQRHGVSIEGAGEQKFTGDEQCWRVSAGSEQAQIKTI